MHLRNNLTDEQHAIIPQFYTGIPMPIASCSQLPILKYLILPIREFHTH